MKIACDLDGCVIALTPAWLDKYNSLELEAPIAPAAIVTYNINRYVKFPKALSAALCAGATALAEPENRSLAGLSKLLIAGHDLVFLTHIVRQNRNGWAEKLDWLDDKGFGDVPVVVCPSELKCRFDADILVEDYPRTIEQWLVAHPAGEAFLIDQSYNQGWEHERCTRVDSIYTMAKMLENRSAK